MNPVSCKVHIDCTVHPTEDAEKILMALRNIFPEIAFNVKSHTIHASSNSTICLEEIREDIHNKRSHKSFHKQFRKNTRNDSFWFYLNKQAAFANVIALCEHDDESPLGPIRVSIKSDQIDTIVEWLLES